MRTQRDRELDGMSERLRWLRASREAGRMGLPQPPLPGSMKVTEISNCSIAVGAAQPAGSGILSVSKPPPGGRQNDNMRGYTPGAVLSFAPPPPSNAELYRQAERLRTKRATKPQPVPSPGVEPDPWRDGNGRLSQNERDYRAALRRRLSPPAYDERMKKRAAMLREFRAATARELRARAAAGSSLC